MNKRGRPPRGAQELPSWFDIEKYRKAETFTAKEWFENLSLRRRMTEIDNEDICRPFDESQPSTQPTAFANILESIKEEPLRDLADVNDAILFNFTHDSPFALRTWIAHQHRCVDIARNRDVWTFFKNFPDHIQKKIGFINDDENKNVIVSGSLPTDDEVAVRNFLGQPIDSSAEDIFLLRVNPHMPDSILMKEFKSYLSAMRKRHNVSQAYFGLRGIKMSKWYETGVLPYIDLMLWAKFEGRQIYIPAFVSALATLLRDRPDDGIIKTTKKYAELLMRKDVQYALAHQSLRETVGKEKKSRKFHV